MSQFFVNVGEEVAILMSSVFSLGLSPVLPLARATSRPALVRSEMILCSNSANIAMSWKNSMPVGMLGLTSSVSDTRLMFRFFNFSSVSMSCHRVHGTGSQTPHLWDKVTWIAKVASTDIGP